VSNLTFITGNAGKAAYLAEHLGVPLAHAKLDLPEIQELDLQPVVQAKALAAYQQLGEPVLVEDTSLVFPALGGLPGPFIQWFEQSLGLEGLCRLLDGKDRLAVATSMFGLCTDGSVQFFSGSVSGSISQQPLGENGFGWDSIFIVEGGTKTWGELGAEGKHANNMRGKALDLLAQRLRA
jgi:non-canonical purine NTP pyrophosphatase (RdgB/HAM1 family)